ncbi:MAG: hypothetical protein HY296_08205 [Thaumarchaeota archaeon]|nr:hypothetical protein [Nitrososphaerota archaeon]
MTEDGELVNWYKALAEDPDYFMNTEAGQKELADMIRKESERLIEELGRAAKRTKEIIWLSRFCGGCAYFRQKGSKMTCDRWAVRIVKPFYGRPTWVETRPRREGDEKELTIEGINWDVKWKEISDKIVEMAVGMVNGGYPYFCYRPD